MGEGRRGGSKLRNAARKIVLACGSFSRREDIVDPVVINGTTTTSNATVLGASVYHPKKRGNISEIAGEAESSSSLATKNLCAICLDPLSYSSRDSSPGQAIFTAQCSHAFHFACISSNVSHGSVTCPICRAHWTQLPRNLNPPCSRSCNLQTDPALRILDDSIATFRVHRRSFLRSARYDDDDPIEPHHHNPNHPRLIFSIVHAPSSHQSFQPSCANPSFQVSYHPHGTSPLHHITSSRLLSQLPPAGNLAAIGQPTYQSASNITYLSVKMAYDQQATDLVLVASPNGPHLRLLKQSMALAVFSLRSIDRLAIVAYSSAAARVFPLRRMTSYGKRAALQVIDRLFYTGQADPSEGLKKGLKILEDRAYKNPRSCILHMSDSPTRPYHAMDMEEHIPIHRFHVGFGLSTSSGFVMNEFEEFLARMLGGVIRETQLWIGDHEGRRMVTLGEVRSGEERRIALNMQGEGRHIVHVGYSYIDGGLDECNITTGETLVGVQEKRDISSADDHDDPEGTTRDGSIGGRTSNAESWDYHDPYMARRWAKHLHGYRL